MVNYGEARVKLTNTQLSKPKSAANNMTGATLIITNKNFQDEELLQELFVSNNKEKDLNKKCFC